MNVKIKVSDLCLIICAVLCVLVASSISVAFISYKISL